MCWLAGSDSFQTDFWRLVDHMVSLLIYSCVTDIETTKIWHSLITEEGINFKSVIFYLNCQITTKKGKDPTVTPQHSDNPK